MKKYGKFFRKAALTAAICLGLSQSVWAMPTVGDNGGVTAGNVTVNGGAFTDPTTGATIATVGGPAIINWQAFGIADGESLAFDTSMGALLNRVTGGNISEIFGKLTQTGGNPMFLVNPAGITVGSTGVIDANTLTLSTLAMSDAQFALAANGIVEFGDGSNPGPLTIEKDAKLTAKGVNLGNDQYGGMLSLLGGTVTVADGVTFSVDNDIDIVAANNVTALVSDAAKGTDYPIGSEAFRPLEISATSDNVLAVGETTIQTSDLAFLAGGKVNLQGTTIESGTVEVRAASSGYTVDSTRVQNRADIVFEAGADNAITIANATLTGSELDVIGGKVNIEGSHLTQTVTGSGSDLDIAALGEYTAYPDGDASNQPLDVSHTLTLKDTEIEFKGNTKAEDKYIFMGAGQVALDNTKVTSNNGIRIASGKDFGREGGTADAKNTLTIANKSNVKADTFMEVMGGSIAVTGSSMSAGEDLHVAAFKTATMSATAKGNGGTNEGGAVTGGTAGDGNTVTLSDAKIDAQSIQIFGGKVDITDGSAITETNTTNKSDLTIMAAPGFVVPADGDGINPDFSNPSGAASSYAVNVKDSSVTLNTSGSTGDPSIDIGAGKITLDRSKVTLTGGEDNGIHVFAISGASGTDDNQVMTATTDNAITLMNGAKVESKGERLAFAGGKIALSDGSTITKESTDKNKPGLFLVANDQIGWDNEGGKYSTAYPVAIPAGAKTEFTASADSKILLNGSDVTKDYAKISGEPVVNTDLPTGGKLANGSVSVNGVAFTGGDLEDKATVTVDPVNNGRQHAVINWDAFNIGTGKSLTFEMLGGPLLNRVTGGNLSSIYGTLTQKGDHPMFLVNPNGILVGKGATIDANQLVLSTLAISDATFQNDTLNDNCVLTTPAGRETPAAVQFKDGAKVSVDCFLKAFGGSVEVSDGVSISGNKDVKDNVADIHLLAANTVNGKIKLNSVQSMSAVADKNTVSISDSKVDSKGRVYLQGGDFNISGSDIRGKGINLRSAEKYISGGSQAGASQDSANTTVTIKDSKIRATKDADGVDGSVGHSFIVGGKISIEGSEIHSVENYRGFQGWTYGGNDYPTYTTGTSNTVSVKDSELLSKRYVRLQGGQVSVDGSDIASNRIQIWAESSYAGPENTMQHIDGSGVTHLTRESGNQVTLTDSSLGVGYNINEVNILGWNANITGSGIEARNVDITAANGWKRASSDGVRTDDYTADGTNAVAISDSTLTSTEGNVHVVAGKVSVDKSELDAARYAQLWIAKGLHLSTEGDKSVKAYEATADNAVSITNSTIASGEGSRSSILGGKLDVKDSAVTGTEITLRASKDYILNGASNNEDAILTLKDSKVDADTKLFAISGKVDVDGSELHAKEQLQLIASETNPVYKAGKANTMKIRNGSTLASEGDVTVFGGDVTMSGKSTASAGENLFFAGGTEMTMKNNVPTLTGDKETTRVSKDSTLLLRDVDVTDQYATTRIIAPESIPEEVADSYIEGMDKMDEVLKPEATPAERQNETQKVVQEINNSSGSSLEKAAAVSGMMQAILLDDNISDSEKVALQKEIIQTFEPTKQVISEANNVVTSATQQAGDAQPQQTQQQSVAVNAGSTAAVPTAAEVNDTPVSIGGTDNQGGAEE